MQPKGTIVLECGQAMLKNGYRVKILNTINFKKSMHYNPFSYVHSEKDILKLVTTLMTNTKGEGSGGDPFWEKSERLLLTALIAYLHYEAPVEEQNFATLLEMLNTMQVLEDDEEYQNPVDLLFEDACNFFCSSAVNGRTALDFFCGSFTEISKGRMRCKCAAYLQIRRSIDKHSCAIVVPKGFCIPLVGVMTSRSPCSKVFSSSVLALKHPKTGKR